MDEIHVGITYRFISPKLCLFRGSPEYREGKNDPVKMLQMWKEDA
jgi:hypothetical protein